MNGKAYNSLKATRVILSLYVLFLILLAFMLCLVFLHDFMGWNVPSILFFQHEPRFALFVFFGEALHVSPGIVEHFQFWFLRVSIFAVFVHVFRYRKKWPPPEMFPYLVLFFGLVLMYINDSANARHVLGGEISLWNSKHQIIDISSKKIKVYTEVVYYGVTGGMMLHFGYNYLFNTMRLLKTNLLNLMFWTGYIFYGFASLASLFRHFCDWYSRVGEKIVQIRPEHVEALYIEHLEFFPRVVYPLGFWIMDWLVEESLEYIAALSLCCFTISLNISPVVMDRKSKCTPKRVRSP